MESGSLQQVPRFPRPYPSDFSGAWVGGGSSRILPSLGAGTRRGRSLLGLSPGGGGAVDSGQRTRRALTEGRAVAKGKALPFLLPITFPGTLLISWYTPWRGDQEGARKVPKSDPRRALLLGWGPVRPGPALPTLPSPRESAPRRGSQQSPGVLLHLLAPSGGRRLQ